LLYRDIDRLGAFENFIDVHGGSFEKINFAG
jgi:hypothetical protein